MVQNIAASGKEVQPGLERERGITEEQEPRVCLESSAEESNAGTEHYAGPECHSSEPAWRAYSGLLIQHFRQLPALVEVLLWTEEPRLPGCEREPHNRCVFSSKESDEL